MHLEIPVHKIEIDRLGPPKFSSPVRLAHEPGQGRSCFVTDDQYVLHDFDITLGAPPKETLLFEQAGPRSKIFFEPPCTKAAIVTCGGLCPGLNDVIRSLVLELHYNYGVRDIIGIRHGYLGLIAKSGLEPIALTPRVVADVHRFGGSFLGSSRGAQDVGKMVDFLSGRGIDILFCIGGDGTLRGAHALQEEIKRRGLEIGIVGIPKTIDNDIQFCDRTFGFVTAVEKAKEVIDNAHTEALGAPRGIGLVKVMGRDAGYIACGATLAGQEVNFVLIPELSFELDGPYGLFNAVEQRLRDRGHAVIVVAEGAGQHLFERDAGGTDQSGNRRYHDIGPYLKARIADYFANKGAPVDLKYIDPSYIIRSAPANCDDSLLCDRLARNAAHAAMSGRTDVLICYENSHFVHVPISLAVTAKKHLDLEGPMWAAVLAATGQPDRFHNDEL